MENVLTKYDMINFARSHLGQLTVSGVANCEKCVNINNCLNLLEKMLKTEDEAREKEKQETEKKSEE